VADFDEDKEKELLSLARRARAFHISSPTVVTLDDSTTAEVMIMAEGMFAIKTAFPRILFAHQSSIQVPKNCAIRLLQETGNGSIR